MQLICVRFIGKHPYRFNILTFIPDLWILGAYSDENSITGTIPTEFGNLQSLLSLSAGKIISGLNKDCSQQYLFYPSNNISLWSDALLFIVIHKVGNRLTGSVPSELGTISTLSSLNLGKLCSCVKCAIDAIYDKQLKDICFLALFSP